MSRSTLLIGALLISVCGRGTMVSAQDSDDGSWKDRYQRREQVGADGSRIVYRWFMPPVEPGEKVPLILFLHGAGERGDDNDKTLVHGARDFISDAVQSKRKCAVLIPQCPTDEKWVDAPWSADSHEMNDEPTGPMALVIEALEEHLRNDSIDPSRIYLTGLSMGGYGSWDLLARYPKRFAAAVPICGGGDSRAEVVARFVDVPIWAFHGGADDVVKPLRSRAMIDALKAAGGSPKYTEYPEVGHDSWTRTYADAALYDWLFAQQLKD